MPRRKEKDSKIRATWVDGAASSYRSLLQHAPPLPPEPPQLDGEVLPGVPLFSPVLRPGHYDHIASSLVPQSAEKDTIPRHALEKSSSSFLNDIETPPSTPSEEEAGTLGIHILCIGKKKHHVDGRLRHRRLAKIFANKMLVLVIWMNIPCLVLQLMYAFYHKLRIAILLDYTASGIVFLSLIVFSLILNYFTGLARNTPYHFFLILVKSVVWGWNYLLAGALVEYLYIQKKISDHFDSEHEHTGETPEQEERVKSQLYHEFVTKEFFDDDGEEHDEELKAQNMFFMFGIAYFICLMISIRILGRFAKLNYFGPIVPFITYTTTFLIILVATIAILATGRVFGEGEGEDENKLWMVIQATCGPLIGCVMAELFTIYLQALLGGKLCPLKREEYLYAAAHY